MSDRRPLPMAADTPPDDGARRIGPSVVVPIVTIAWLAALALFASWLVIELAPRARLTVAIDPREVRPELGGAWIVDLHPDLPPWLACRGDTLATGNASDLEIRENGVRLGPSHAPHQSIRDERGGRYSHWHDHLIFSTSDGSDPRTNGRVYEVTATPRAAGWVGTAALGCALGALAIGALAWGTPRGRIARRLPFAAFAIVAVALLVVWNGTILAFAPSFAGVQADSTSYLQGSTIRTIGYPLILRAITAVAGDLRPLVTVQVNALVLSLIALSAAVAVVLAHAAPGGARRAPCWGIGAIALLLMGTATRSFETSFTVMADGPFTAIVCVAAALLGLSATRRGSWPIAGASIAVAIAILVRPAGLGLLPALLLPCWWHRHRAELGDGSGASAKRGRAAAPLAAAIVPLALVLGAAATANQVRHGFFGLSRMGAVSLAGQVAWLISPESAPGHAELAGRIQAKAKAIMAKRPPLSWPVDYYLHTSEEYNPLLYQTVLPEVAQWMREHPAQGVDWDTTQERILKDLAVGAIMHAPADYAQHVAANVLGSTHWFGRGAALLPGLHQTSIGSAECVKNLPASARPLFDGWYRAPDFPENWNRNLFWERLRRPIDDRPRLFATLACAATLLGMAFLPWSGRRVGPDSALAARVAASPAMRWLGALGVMAWGSISLIAISATVIFRYIDALDPLLSSAVVIAAVLLWRAIARRSAFALLRPAPASAAA